MLSPFYNNGWCVRERQALAAPKSPQGVLVHGQTGLVVHKLFPVMFGEVDTGFAISNLAPLADAPQDPTILKSKDD